MLSPIHSEIRRHPLLGPKAADQANLVQLRVLRTQLKLLPDVLKEEARVQRLIVEDTRLRDLQDFLMISIEKLEHTLRNQLIALGQSPLHFQIGGHERGVYEKFFRVEPAVHMSKPQLFVAMARSFGDESIKSEKNLTKLFNAFDTARKDEMDW